MANLDEIVYAQIEGLKQSGGVTRGICPLCGSRSSLPFIVFRETLNYFCHACEASGTSQRLLDELGVDYQDANYIPPKIEEVKPDEIDFSGYAGLCLANASAYKNRAKYLFDEMIRPWGIINESKLNGIVGYDAYHDTLAVIVRDGDRVVNVKRRRVGSIKWCGMKHSDGKYVMRRLTGNPLVFVASGMAEFLILHASPYDYIVAQSDSGVRSVAELVPAGVLPVILEDNDLVEIEEEEDRKFADALHSHMYNRFTKKFTSKFEGEKIVVNFQNVLDRDLPAGYDLRDFVNDYWDWDEFIKNEIEYQIKNP